jgi:dolichol-phosphate mannosyltransferase
MTTATTRDPEARAQATGGTRQCLSIVIPCFNEELAFPFLRERITLLADGLTDRFNVELVFVDDGSRDGTWTEVRRFAQEDERVRGIALSRNFGHQFALTCGYEAATGAAVVSMDADLQDPPEVVHEMIARWLEGADIVYAIRRSRAGESVFKRATAHLFYRMLHWMGARRVRRDSGDFRLMSRRALDALLEMRETHRFIRGMVGWIGFVEAEVHYDRAERVAGATKYPFRKMLRLALDASVSFSMIPLRVAYIGAFFVSAVFLVYLAVVVIRVTLFDAPLVPGWTSLLLAAVAFGATNLLCLGLLGEYVGRIYEQTKQRPLYYVKERAGWREA